MNGEEGKTGLRRLRQAISEAIAFAIAWAVWKATPASWRLVDTAPYDEPDDDIQEA